MQEGPQPRPASDAVRSGISFVLTLVLVIVLGALGGYGLGRYVFDRFVTTGVPAARSVVPSYDSTSLPSTAAGLSTRAGGTVSPATRSASPAPERSAAQPTESASTSRGTSGGASGQTFFVQVGAFGSKERADAMAERLRGDGFPVVVETQPGNPVLYKVWVGPYGRRDEALKALQQIKPTVPDAFIP